MSADDAVRVTSRVAVDPATAFRVFTEEVDAWWRSGPRFRWHPERGGTLRFEPGENGRFVEVYPDGESFEVGRIRVWEPPRRLVFGFRARSFASGEDTEVEVRFEANGDATDVTVEHRGFAALRSDHPARHGMDRSAFRNMMGGWWADLLTAARRHAAARTSGGRAMRTPRSDKGFDLEHSYLVLSDGPQARRIEVGPEFWQTIDERRDLAGRLVAIFRYDADWKVWEMHPDGDELVVLLSGAVDLVLDQPGGERIVELRDSSAAVVPGGVWHTANVHGASAALHVTRGAGTAHRPRAR